MKQLLIHNNKVVQVSDETFPVHLSLQWVEGEGNVGDDYIDGLVIPHVEYVPVKTWRQERKEAYDSLGDQFDTIYKQIKHMKDLGQITLVPEAQKWVDKVTKIKTDYPKE